MEDFIIGFSNSDMAVKVVFAKLFAMFILSLLALRISLKLTTLANKINNSSPCTKVLHSNQAKLFSLEVSKLSALFYALGMILIVKEAVLLKPIIDSIFFKFWLISGFLVSGYYFIQMLLVLKQKCMGCIQLYGISLSVIVFYYI